MTATGYNDGKTDTVSAYLFDTSSSTTSGRSMAASAKTTIAPPTTPTRPAPSPTCRPRATCSTGSWRRSTSRPLQQHLRPVRYLAAAAGRRQLRAERAANSAANANYAPQKTKTSELGTKWDLLDKKLAVTAALFRTEVTNEVELDATSGQYFQNGKKTVQGIELGVTGDVTSNLSLTAGYTYMKTKVDSGAITTAAGENNLAYTPKQAFTSWATYRLPQGFTGRRCALRELAAARHRRRGRHAQVCQRLLGLRWHGRLRGQQERGPAVESVQYFRQGLRSGHQQERLSLHPGHTTNGGTDGQLQVLILRMAMA
jgi:catecholate siderophore receptor